MGNMKTVLIYEKEHLGGKTARERELLILGKSLDHELSQKKILKFHRRKDFKSFEFCETERLPENIFCSVPQLPFLPKPNKFTFSREVV
jgi:hypothetical protein